MPTYRVTDPVSGRTVNLTGDSPPTEQELKETFANIEGNVQQPQNSLFGKIKGFLKSGINASSAESDVLGGSAQFATKENTLIPAADMTMRALPIIGATGGAMVGTSMGPWGTVGGAGLGGASGSAVEDVLRRLTGIGPQPTTPGLNPLKTGAEMATWEAGGGPLLNILSKVSAPVRDAFRANPEAQALQQFSMKNELPFGASTIQPSKIASAVEWFVNLFPTGKHVTTKYQAELYKKFLDTRSNVLAELTGTGETMAGKELKEGIRETKAAYRDKSIEAYGDIIPTMGGKKEPIDVPNTKEFIESILETPRVKRNKSLEKLLHTFDTESQYGSLNADQFYAFQSLINKTVGKDMALGQDIWSALSKDIKAFDEMSGKKLMDVVSKAKSSWQVERGFDVVSGLMKKSTRTALATGEEVFQPGQFYSLVTNDANKKIITKLYGDDVYKNMLDYAEYMRKAGMEIEKRKLSDMQKIWQGAMTVGGGAGSIYTSPMIAVPYGMSYAMAHMIMKPRGVFKKWLTEGFSIPGGAKEAIKVGGRTAIVEKDE